MSKKDYPSVEYVRQCIREENGRIFWLERPQEYFTDAGHWKMWNKRFANREAGCAVRAIRKHGVDVRWVIHMDHQHLLRASLVWLLHKGEWPTSMVDHKNREPLDDQIDNLRLATTSQNCANAKVKATNRWGFKGVTYEPNSTNLKKWRAQVTVNRKRIHLGNFDTPEEAHAAYCKAAREHFGEFACDGKEGK